MGVLINQDKQLSKTAKKYQVVITDLYGKTVKSIIAVGQKILEAENKLPSDEYFDLLHSLPFSDETAKKFRLIAENKELTKPENILKLPPAYSTLYQISQLSANEIKTKIVKGEINPNMTRMDAEEIKNKTKKKKAKRKKPLLTVATITLSDSAITEGLSDEATKVLNKLANRFPDKLQIQYGKEMAELNIRKLEEIADEKIENYNKTKPNYDDKLIKSINSAMNYLDKSKMKVRVVNGEKKFDFSLPETHPSWKELSKKLKDNEITETKIRSYCQDNNILTAYTTIRQVNTEVYIWQQVKLFADGNPKLALNNLRSQIHFMTKPRIRSLAEKIINELESYA